MVESSDKDQRKKKATEVKIFPVPFGLGEKKQNITITTNNRNQPSKEEIINQAFKLHLQGNILEATKYYKLFIYKGFKDYRVFSNYAVILQNLGKFREAEILTRKAIELNPDCAEAYSNLGNILKDLRKLKEAELSQRKAIQLNPDFEKAHSNLGVVLKDLGKLKEAESSQRKAIQLNPDFAKAHSNLGDVLKDLGKLKEAELSQRKAIQLNPDFAEAHFNLGTILEMLGKPAEAMNCWVKAVELKPQDDKLVIGLAHNLCYGEKYELALKYLSQNKSNSSQSLYLGCLLSLNREKDFNKKYKELFKKKACNADIGGIVEHANIIYGKKYNSPFCNEAINYVFLDKINEELFSDNELKELISYSKMSKKENRSQDLLTNGIQTSGNLFSLDYPFIKSIKKALEIKIKKYKQQFQSSGQGFINNWPENYELSSWIINMKSGGFLKSHNHEYGWITGSFYLQVPKYKNNNDSGNIAFSYQGPRYPSKEQDFNLTIKKIETRDICIFPSSLFHHTIPFKSSEERICFVFDLVQI
tara:strand:+ start:881 stop:2473 length:1593 start_codon:yes stop_codon:yes gene_type:complete